jgi:hypothetical protein
MCQARNYELIHCPVRKYGKIQYLVTTKIENLGYKIRLHLIRIGETAIIGVNGELYTSHGLKIQEASPMKNTIVVNHDSSLVMDNPAYIYDDETIRWWENADKCTIPGRTDFRGIAGTIEESLVNHTRNMFEKIL